VQIDIRAQEERTPYMISFEKDGSDGKYIQILYASGQTLGVGTPLRGTGEW
jgi:hypothetical protein